MLRSSIFISFILFSNLNLYALEASQIHARYGGISAAYDGVVSGEIQSLTLFELEYEGINNNHNSFYLRLSESFDSAKSIFNYSYFGGGMKYYFASKALLYEGSDGANILISVPKWRYYVGWEIGIAHVVLQTVGEFLRVSTSSYDYGGVAGSIYNITNRIGVEFNFTTQFSTGFTSISTGAVVYKGSVGLTYFL